MMPQSVNWDDKLVVLVYNIADDNINHILQIITIYNAL